MDIKKHIPKVVAFSGLVGLIFAFVSVGKGKNALNNFGKFLPEDGSANNPIDATEIANTIHEIMRVTNWSNSNKNNIIFEALGTLNPSQFAQVSKAFGLRYYNPKLGDDMTYFGIKPSKYNLAFWLKSELNDNEYLTLKSRFSKYLK